MNPSDGGLSTTTANRARSAVAALCRAQVDALAVALIERDDKSRDFANSFIDNLPQPKAWSPSKLTSIKEAGPSSAQRAVDEAVLPLIASLPPELLECVCYVCTLQTVARLACTSQKLRAVSYRGVLPLMAPETAKKKVDGGKALWEGHDGKVVLARWAADRRASAAVVTALLGAHRTVDRMAFWECQALMTISIPEPVQAIGGAAFIRCSALETITLPASVQTIGKSAFYECRALKTITLPASLQTIDTNAFWGCSALTSVTLPRSLEGQMEDAFLTTSRIPGLQVTFT